MEIISIFRGAPLKATRRQTYAAAVFLTGVADISFLPHVLANLSCSRVVARFVDAKPSGRHSLGKAARKAHVEPGGCNVKIERRT